jgi:small-conductance mechanosensitive channel
MRDLPITAVVSLRSTRTRLPPTMLSCPARSNTTLIVFEEFGDSTLNFVVRAFLASMDDRLQTIQEMNSEIHRRFAAAGIEIAFPQRDIHFRTAIPAQSSDNAA